MGLLKLEMIVCAVLALGLVQLARADEGEDALIRSRREYFNGLMESPSNSRQETTALYRKTLGATNLKLHEAFANRWQEAVRRRTHPGNQIPSLGPDPKLWRQKQAEFEGKPSQAVAQESSSQGEEGPADSTPPEETRAARSETALDGSNVPRLLEFGPKKRFKSPSSSGASH